MERARLSTPPGKTAASVNWYNWFCCELPAEHEADQLLNLRTRARVAHLWPQEASGTGPADRQNKKRTGEESNLRTQGTAG